MTEQEAIIHIDEVVRRRLIHGHQNDYIPGPFRPEEFGIKDCPLSGEISHEEIKQMLMRQT